MFKVVVIGGSFAGLTGALEAKRKLGSTTEVILISKTDSFVYIPSLIWVPFGWRTVQDLSIPLKPILDKHGVKFIQTEVTKVEPENNKVITGDGEVDYDYLLVASGVSTRFDLIEGLGPDKNTYSVCTPSHAEEAGEGWRKLINDPGPVVVGASQGASCMGAGYEFLFNLEYAARKVGIRDKIDITWITPEPFLAHFGIGGMAGG
ncbi:MAG: FAD/NAD(P)-binding oxidoreductase, partial [Thermoleophilia bacterium]